MVALLALLAPYTAGYAFHLVRPDGSLSNAFLEPLILGAVVSLLQIIVFSVPGRDQLQRRVRFGVAIAVACLVGTGMALWFPILPE